MFTILIADDETAVRDNMINSVDWDSLGLKIIGVADNGLTAYDYISVHQPDLALIDIRMPGMSGLDIIRRAAEENIRTRFIIISGFDRFEYAQMALEYHAFKYLLKPFSHQELTDSLRAAVEALPTLANRSGVSGLLGSAVPNNAQIVYPHECEHAILRGITACSDAQELRALVHAFICAAQRKNDSDQAVLHCVMII